jgi:hypothetical protein
LFVLLYSKPKHAEFWSHCKAQSSALIAFGRLPMIVPRSLAVWPHMTE